MKPHAATNLTHSRSTRASSVSYDPYSKSRLVPARHVKTRATRREIQNVPVFSFVWERIFTSFPNGSRTKKLTNPPRLIGYIGIRF